MFSLWAMGCTASLAFSKMPDAGRKGVTTEGVLAIRRKEEQPQATQQAEPYGGSGKGYFLDTPRSILYQISF